jgi:hypothetical protein
LTAISGVRPQQGQRGRGQRLLFRQGRVPAYEGAALRAEFAAEMNWVYAIMNAAKEPYLGD